MQVENFLERSAAQLPDKVALVCGDRRLTYRELDEQANRLAHAMMAEGVCRWDRVAIYLENSPEAVIAMFAALKAGGIFLVINPTTKADKLAYILDNCRAKVLVTDVSKRSEVEAALPNAPKTEAVLVAGSHPEPFGGRRFRTLQECLADFSPERPPKQCINVDPAALIYTSGSTGRPKGVMLSHLNICSAAESITTYLENTADDVILDVLPLSFDYGLYQVLMAFKVGARVVLERSFAYPYSVIETAMRENITGLPIVPTMASILLQMDLSQIRLPSLRYITNTAAALPTSHIRRLREAFPHAKLYSMYGLTECKRVSYLPPEQLDIRPASVGKAIPNSEVYLVDEAGNRVGPGVPGELVVRGANVMMGYWEAPEETAKVLKPGLFPGERVLYTGDVFTMDEEGYLYFVGRKDDIIKTRGEKVSPKEIEEVLYSIDGIVDAAVVGVPDPILGQAIKAIVTLRPDCKLTAKEIQKHCTQRLEDFMVPKIVEIRDSLPRTTSGKISKRLLAAAGEGA
ncbi:MAG TPA: AMP-binding protein [Bryobacteraceae bacterium]|nr:AMP-binding protein [Bryobacteraceae bacterium]HOQ47064.1 AMP-binding protein [Bryobacteraceae bacterium]HPQ15238.1 AMP-binding protein [Bryobacteraceae bacterium]HPU71063.1 AMP-binding protein [Bryobacteraceae bacterium]